MASNTTMPLLFFLELFQLSQEYPEMYLEGSIESDLPKASLTMFARGEKDTYPATMYRRKGETRLRFRVRIPAQSFSFGACIDDQDVPVRMILPDNEPILHWKEPFAFESLPGIGVFVPAENGFDLVKDNKMWLAKRRLLRIRHHLSAEGVHALRFWDRDEERESRTQERKNQCILGIADSPANPGHVNLECWKPGPDGANLGDYLSWVVTEWMLQKKGLSFDDPVPDTRFLAAVGSIVGMGCNDDTVWGSGLLWAKCPGFISPETKSLDIRAVRGPETKRLLEARGYTCPDVFGDPAILMPLIYQPASPTKKKPSLVIAHMFDQSESDLDIMTTDYRGFIDVMIQAELVISSSLHGIILAEAYGIPAILFDDCRPDFSLHKYRDWYCSTGRTEFPVARTIEEARTMTPAPLPDLVDMQQRLIETFPYDLWEQ